MLLELLGGGRRTRLEHDDRVDLLTPCRVGDADHGDLLDRRVGRDRVLDLDRVDVLAAGDDHVLDPVDEVDVAVGVEVALVAGVVPAVAERSRGLLRAASSTRCMKLPARAQTSPFSPAGDRRRPRRWTVMSTPITGRPAERSAAPRS